MKKVQSFDVFDTLIARKCKEPTDLFDIIEKNLPCRHFKALRIESQRIASSKNGIYTNIDHIYDEYKALNDIADTELLKKAELDYEYEYSIPIVENIKKIKPGDIYISDMYLKKDQIYKLLSKHNINTENSLYVTNGGKSMGTIYEELLRTYYISLHTGDNLHSDIEMAQKYKINTYHTRLSEYTDTENILYNMKLIDLQNSIREFRLKNDDGQRCQKSGYQT
jgi:predicted HAD superfamily hydrolase